MSSSGKDGHLRSSHWGIVLNPPMPQRQQSHLRYDTLHGAGKPHSSSQSGRRHPPKQPEKKKQYSRQSSQANKPFKCLVCHHSFERSGHLKTHIVAVHEQRQPFSCDHPGCGQSFGHRSSLSRHKKGIHKIE